MCLAVGTALSAIPLFHLPQGGTVTLCSTMFLVVVSYWFGVSTGVLCGFVFGLLQMIFSASLVHPIQILLDYPLSYAAFGLGGLFAGKKHGLQIGYVVGCLGRFAANFASGVIFYSDYAPEGQSAVLYSAVYNATYVGIEMVMTIIVLSLPPVQNAIKSVRDGLDISPEAVKK
jgi:thiamine transporter